MKQYAVRKLFALDTTILQQKYLWFDYNKLTN